MEDAVWSFRPIAPKPRKGRYGFGSLPQATAKLLAQVPVAVTGLAVSTFAVAVAWRLAPTVTEAQSSGVITCPGPYGFWLRGTGRIWFNAYARVRWIPELPTYETVATVALPRSCCRSRCHCCT